MLTPREEEIVSVQAIYCDDDNLFQVIDDTHYCFNCPPISLSIYLPPSYPNCPVASTSASALVEELPTVSLDSNGLSISRLQMSQLQSGLEQLIYQKVVAGEPILFDITEETREFTMSIRVEIAQDFDDFDDEDTWDNVYGEDEELEDYRISDPSIIRGHMGSTTIESIMSKLPSSTKLLYAEPVLRADLREKYRRMRSRIQREAALSTGAQGRRAKDAAYDDYGQERIVFHGTMRSNVGSIVRSGFVVPGHTAADGRMVDVRCGSTWGQGIYTSPEPMYSLSYTDYTEMSTVRGSRLLPGQKLIVCAVVLGRQYNITACRRLDSTVTQGYHSHISPNKCEYVVFESAQVLPLFVLHLANQASGLPQMSDSGYRMPVAGYVKLTMAGKLSMTEYAKKYLPMGFGPASGKRFIVEDMAPVDDDEELWGEYQHDEGEFQEDRRSAWW